VTIVWEYAAATLRPHLHHSISAHSLRVLWKAIKVPSNFILTFRVLKCTNRAMAWLHRCVFSKAKQISC